MSDCRHVSIAGDPAAPVRLVCFPYAGGNAEAFRPFGALAGRLGVEVVAIELPGHGRSIGAPPRVDVDEVTESIVAAVEAPYVFFGHSLGGRVAFEVARRLSTMHGRAPRHLFVSGTPAPRLPRIGRGDSRLPDDEFVARIVAMGGTPAEVLADPGLRRLLLPVLRCDFAWCDAYEYVPGPPLAVPLTALSGSADPEAPVGQVAAWAAETSAAFRLAVFDGDHFYLRSRVAEVLDAIAADLPWAGRPVAAAHPH